MLPTARSVVFASFAVLAASSAAQAGSHLWKFSEVFSSPDGSVQFVELFNNNSSAGEVFLAGHTVKSLATGKQFTFPGNLSGSTAFKHLLLATPAFAALPGAPTPDFIIPANFFGTNGDTLTYHVYDTWVIGATAVPLDCVNSLNRNGTASANSPTNFQNVTGSVIACSSSCTGDVDGSGTVDAGDLAVLLGAWGGSDPDADLNGDGTVNASDLAVLLGAWGACP